METADCVGSDVSRDWLDVALRPANQHERVPYDEEGIALLVERLCPLQPVLVVLEGTGGLEVPATAALATAGRAVAVVNPRQVRDVAKATGQLATTDLLDAHVLAHFSEVVRPPPAAQC